MTTRSGRVTIIVQPWVLLVASAKMQKRCFVISPIGAEGSEIRDHADDVFEFIIKPAMDELEIHAYRSDHTLVPGKITEQMFDSLLKDDLCVAILTYQNPNVYYELAIAQSAGRPTVLMVQKGHALPFDIADLRTIEYDFRPRALRDGVYVQQLIGHVRSIEQCGWRSEVPFGRSLSPLGAAPPAVQLYNDLRSFGGEEHWLDVLGETRNRFWTAGISMIRLTTRRFRTALVEKAQSGCDVRIMVLSRDNPSFPGMINEADGIGRFERIVNLNAEIERELSSLSRTTDGLVFKQIQNGCLHQQLILTDRLAVARPYCYSRTTSEAPILVIERPNQLAETFDAEFEAFWRLN
jgi:hypothetical protein